MFRQRQRWLVDPGATNSPANPPSLSPVPSGVHSPDPAAASHASQASPTPQAPGPQRRRSFGDDFQRFFFRGLAAILPTLITLSLLFWIWNFLWQNLGVYIIELIKLVWYQLGGWWVIPKEPAGHIRHILNEDVFWVRLLGVGLAILFVYIVGVFLGNLIGRTLWRLVETGLMRLPLIRAIYPSVKQVVDFLLSDQIAGGRKGQFSSSRVVAVQARAQGIWAIGLVTGTGYGPLNEAIRGDMLTIFIPSSPTALAGYVVVAHREAVVELPLTVEDALRLLVSGGVIMPGKTVPGQPGQPALPPGGFEAAPAKPGGEWPGLSPDQFGIVVQKPAQATDLSPRTGRDGGLAVPEA
jgi:uncharacterized membrane protein